MKPTSTLKAALAASTLAITSCDKAPGTAKNTQRTQDQTEAILVKPNVSRREAELIEISLKSQDRTRLYGLIDNGENTTEYFTQSSEYYEKQGKNHELAGRLADVRARLMTLADLIRTHGISEEDVKNILDNNLLISGAHETKFSPHITIEILPRDIDQFFRKDGPLTGTLKDDTLSLKKGSGGLAVSIKY